MAGPVEGVTEIVMTTGSNSKRMPPDVKSTPFGDTSTETTLTDEGGDLHMTESLRLNEAGTTTSPNLHDSRSETKKFLPITVTKVKPATVP